MSVRQKENGKWMVDIHHGPHQRFYKMCPKNVKTREQAVVYETEYHKLLKGKKRQQHRRGFANGFKETFFQKLIRARPSAFFSEALIAQADVSKWRLNGNEPDILFVDLNGRVVIVEVQMETLNREHTYKLLEYRDEIERHLEVKDARMIAVVIGGDCPSRRKDFLKKHGIELLSMDYPEIEKIILSLVCPEFLVPIVVNKTACNNAK